MDEPVDEHVDATRGGGNRPALPDEGGQESPPWIDEPTVALDHPRFRSVWASIFTRRLAPDCMTHRCTMVETHRERLDACCQYGCDVDLAERDAIEARGDQIRAE